MTRETYSSTSGHSIIRYGSDVQGPMRLTTEPNEQMGIDEGVEKGGRALPFADDTTGGNVTLPLSPVTRHAACERAGGG